MPPVHSVQPAPRRKFLKTSISPPGRAPRRLRRQHRRRHRQGAARRCDPDADGDRPALWRGVRSRLAQSARRSATPRGPARSSNDERADWAAAWALFPGTIAYVWHGALHATTVAESLSTGLHHPGPDHLGQGAAGHRPRRLPLAARAVLVRGAQQGQLDRRPQADHALDDPERRPGRRDHPRHAEAGRMHAPADAEQQRARARPSTSRSSAAAPR